MQRLALQTAGCVAAAAAGFTMAQMPNHSEDLWGSTVEKSIARAYGDRMTGVLSGADIERIASTTGVAAPDDLAARMANGGAAHDDVMAALALAKDPNRAAELLLATILPLSEDATIAAALERAQRVPPDALSRYLCRRRRGDAAVVQRLVDLGADPNARPLPLTLAVNDPPVARILLDAGADPLCAHRGESSLQAALQFGDPDVAEWLYDAAKK